MNCLYKPSLNILNKVQTPSSNLNKMYTFMNNTCQIDSLEVQADKAAGKSPPAHPVTRHSTGNEKSLK